MLFESIFEIAKAQFSVLNAKVARSLSGFGFALLPVFREWFAAKLLLASIRLRLTCTHLSVGG